MNKVLHISSKCMWLNIFIDQIVFSLWCAIKLLFGNRAIFNVWILTLTFDQKIKTGPLWLWSTRLKYHHCMSKELSCRNQFSTNRQIDKRMDRQLMVNIYKAFTSWLIASLQIKPSLGANLFLSKLKGDFWEGLFGRISFSRVDKYVILSGTKYQSIKYNVTIINNNKKYLNILFYNCISFTFLLQLK